MAQPGEQVQPAAEQLQPLTAGQGGGVGWGQAGFLGQHQPQQQPVDGPGQAAAGQPAALFGIEAPAEAAALQQWMQGRHLGAAELEVLLQRRTLQQGFQRRGGEPLSRQRQQLQQAAAEARLALLAAVGESPRQVHPGGLAVAKYSRHQRRQAIHLGGHHQHIPGLERGIGSEQLQDPVAHDLHLAQGAGTAMELQGAISRGPLQPGLFSRIRQLLLQLMQQGRRPRAAMGRGGREKQVLFRPLALVALAAALKQLLEFAAQPAEAGFQSRGLQQPVAIEGLAQGDGVAEHLTAAGAALPQIAAGGEQIQVHLGVQAQGLEQLHLDRRQAAEPKQAQGGGQAPRWWWSLLQLGDGVAHPQAKGLHLQSLAQQRHQSPLPGLLGGQGRRLRPVPPGRQQVGPIEGCVVEGIGDAAAQLPLGQVQLPAAALAAAPPVAQGLGLGLLEQLGQQLQHGPHQLVGAPGILVAGGIAQHGIDDLAQLAARKRVADVGGDPPQVHGQLFAQPAAGGPGVDHHLHRREGVRRVQPQLGSQQFGQVFSPVAPENGEQGLGSAGGHQGRQPASCLLKGVSLRSRRPGTAWMAPVSGQ